jgi:site-specific DNA-methyltransferase (adenine-specific)
MDLMKQYPDKHFDLAIIDPPWGKNAGCTRIKKSKKTMKIYDDIRPDRNYIDALFRVSKNQIIFSANLFDGVPIKTGGWIFWDKCNHYKIFSDGELIWVSFKNTIRKYTFDMGYGRGFDYSDRIHPNQKPIELYKYLLSEYAKANWKILDTHFGSGSIAIACNEMGFNLTASEIDEDYFNTACKRIKEKTEAKEVHND